MTALSYPQEGPWATDEALGGFLRFAARPFETTLDDQSESSKESGSVHDIYLPYPNVVSTDTAIWDQGANDGFWGYTDADSWNMLGRGAEYTLGNIFTLGAQSMLADRVEMELSMAAFKMPQLRQRHYSWNLINRQHGDGYIIATICRSFQASVYPRQERGTGGVVGFEMVNPPPMWDVAFAHPHEVPSNHINADNPKPNPIKSGNWRWHMDQFLSVLMSVTISPTQLTDGSMAVSRDGFPLATTLKLSFLEISQAVANKNWTSILPYSVATDDSAPMLDSGAMSEL